MSACGGGGGGDAPTPSQVRAETSSGPAAAAVPVASTPTPTPAPAPAVTPPPAATPPVAASTPVPAAPPLAATAPVPAITPSAPTSTTTAIVPVAPAATPTPNATLGDALPTDAIFAPTSFWYQPIPANVALHPNTTGFLADFLRQKAAYYGTVNINTWSYASPVYNAAPDTPTTKVAYSNCQYKLYGEPALEAQWTAVPIPALAAPADGSDAEMTVYQKSTDTLWEFWVTKNVDGAWKACWGGKMTNVSKSNGIFPFPYGTTATGLPFIGGQITAEELTRGEIRHVIGISLVETETNSILSWPALRSDGFNPTLATNRIPEGLRFRLDPSINVDLLPMTKAGRIIAKAAQKYGFIVWDKAGALSIRAQNPKSYTALGQTNPYPALFGNKPSYAVLDGFPWEKLQFLPMNYGKP
ncbi:MAG TPA: DUF4124 domain-containing protein [Telluria sp.]